MKKTGMTVELDRTAGAGDRAARGPGLAGAQSFAECGACVALAEIDGELAEQAAFNRSTPTRCS